MDKRWMLAALPLFVACQGEPEGERLASVNQESVTRTELEAVMAAQPALRKDEAAQRLALQRLVDQELAMQAAEKAKLEHTPAVQAQLLAARREILSRAWLLQQTGDEPAPDAAALQAEYDAHPERYAQRRLYRLQEWRIAAQPAQAQALQQLLTGPGGAPAMMAEAGRLGLQVQGGELQRGSDQLTVSQRQALGALQPGQASVEQTPAGLQVLALVAAQDAPVSFAQAEAALREGLTRQRQALRAQAALQQLRRDSKIAFAPGWAPVPAASAASAGASR